MTIVASDTFDGLGNNVQLNASRALDNGLGGSGSRNWINTGAYLLGDGADKLKGTANTQRGLVAMDAGGSYKARIRFNQGGGTSAITLAGHDTADSGASNRVAALLVGGNSLRVREAAAQNWGTGTDRATKAISAIGASTDYWLELEINATTKIATARVLNADLSVYDSVSYTFGALPGGTRWGPGFNANGNTGSFDSFVVEDLPAGSALLSILQHHGANA